MINVSRVTDESVDEAARRAPVIEGPTKLPQGFDHPHASEEARRIAQEEMITRVQVGSGVHGTSIHGRDDRDEMGICLEPAAYVTGLARVPSGTRSAAAPSRFEQFDRHTVWDRPGGAANRSGPGDLDVIVYSARKWASLALAGNPTVLLVLFVPDDEVVVRNEVGAKLGDNAHRFVSKLAADRFLGYLRSQRAAMTGEGRRPHQSSGARRGPRVRHQVRHARACLGVQRIELRTRGRITLPIPEPDVSYLRAIRRGEPSSTTWWQASAMPKLDSSSSAAAARSRPAGPRLGQPVAPPKPPGLLGTPPLGRAAGAVEVDEHSPGPSPAVGPCP